MTVYSKQSISSEATFLVVPTKDEDSDCLFAFTSNNLQSLCVLSGAYDSECFIATYFYGFSSSSSFSPLILFIKQHNHYDNAACFKLKKKEAKKGLALIFFLC